MDVADLRMRVDERFSRSISFGGRVGGGTHHLTDVDRAEGEDENTSLTYGRRG